MKVFKRKSSFGGDRGSKRPGGRDFGKRGFGGHDSERGGFDRPQLFRSTCADCGNSCEVPFKPNGRKPVYCSDCFKKEENAEPRQFENRSFEKPAFRTKRTYDAAPQHNSQLDRQLEEVHAKLDRILKEIELLKKDNQ